MDTMTAEQQKFLDEMPKRLEDLGKGFEALRAEVKRGQVLETFQPLPGLSPYLPRSFRAAQAQAEYLCRASIIPSDLYEKPADVLIIILTGAELRLSAVQALRTIHVVEGRPYLSSMLKSALVKQHPQCIYFRCRETTDQRAVYETQRKGSPVQVLEFTLAEAERAGLVTPTRKGNASTWMKWAQVMLRHRAEGQLADMEWPDVVLGLGTWEDVVYEREAAKETGGGLPTVQATTLHRVVEVPAAAPASNSPPEPPLEQPAAHPALPEAAATRPLETLPERAQEPVAVVQAAPEVPAAAPPPASSSSSSKATPEQVLAELGKASTVEQVDALAALARTFDAAGRKLVGDGILEARRRVSGAGRKK